jgi:hypothetical protein
MLTGRSRLTMLADEAVEYVEALRDTEDADLGAARRQSTEKIEAFVDEVARWLKSSL